MGEANFLQDLAIVMAASAVITIVFHRLRIPVVLGYLLTGFLIGPHTPPYSLVTDLHSIQTLSELGVVFLLFTIGLEFSITKLLRVGLVAFVTGILKILMMFGLGYAIGGAFGWKAMDGIFLGAILSISSTTIIAKMLVDFKVIHEKFAHIILGVLIVEDILAVVIIALLSGIATTGQLTLHEAAVSTMRVVTFIVVGLTVSALVVPRLLAFVERLKVNETMTVTALGLAFGAALLAVRAGFSAALGAFLMGAVIAETRQMHAVVRRMEPLRDMFTAVFFVSVGMLIDPHTIVRFAGPILVIAAASVAVKIVGGWLGAFLTGHSATNSLKVGLGLGPIGEFSFIIAQLGQSLGVTSGFLYPITVSVSAVTSLTTPILMQRTPAIVNLLTRITPRSLANFAAFYTSWLGHVGGVQFEGGRKNEIWKGLRKYVPRLLAYLLLGAVVYFGALEIRNRFDLAPSPVFWTLTGVAMFPVLLGMAHAADRIFWNAIFLNLWKTDGHMDVAGEAGRGVHNVFRFMMMVLAGAVLLAVGSFFDPAPPLGVGVAGLIVISGVLLWGSVRKMHEKVESVVLGVFDRESGTPSLAANVAQDELVKFIREQYPWEVEILDFMVPYKESALHQSIRGLAVRRVTGASVVAIYRGDHSIPNPGPDEGIQPGDVLLLMGDKDQILRANKYLREKAVEEPPQHGGGVTVTRRVVVPTGAACAGQSIRQVNLRPETNVTVLGLEREGQVFHNPESEMILRVGDTLILFGTSVETGRATELLLRLSTDPV